MQIDREDMLELTRRMTVKRNCFSRIAGAYFDAEGYIDGTFNVNFRNLTVEETQANLMIAKTVPFSETNVELTGHSFPGAPDAAEIKRLLLALQESGLKNDALLEVFYEKLSQAYQPGREYAVLVFLGCYDVPVKGTDHERLDDSEEVYDFLIGAVCPMKGEYEPDLPEAGFLFPAFTGRSSDSRHIAVYAREGTAAGGSLMEILGI